MKYTNYSGGALGADFQWKTIGLEYNIDTVDFLTKSLTEHLNLESEIESNYVKACGFLARPILNKDSHGGKLVRRNYLQTYFSDAIFGIADLIKPGIKDKKGFINKSVYTVVSGGTAYAITYGILNNKPVFVFNQDDNNWYTWDSDWVICKTPILTYNFAGIGTREINKFGIEAIKNVYEKSIKL